MAACNEAVLKYELDRIGDSVVRAVVLPAGCKTLHFGFQRHRLFVWARVNLDEKGTEVRRFHVLCTGQELEDSVTLRFMATLMIEDGAYVFHIFEEIPDA